MCIRLFDVQHVRVLRVVKMRVDEGLLVQFTSRSRTTMPLRVPDKVPITHSNWTDAQNTTDNASLQFCPGFLLLPVVFQASYLLQS